MEEVIQQEVTPFYLELKKLREKQEINLSDIGNRTKINIKFLESMEAGDFSFLPYVYVRLFLRAYVTEIGADPKESLNNLNQYLGRENQQLKSEGKVPEVEKTPLIEKVEERQEESEGDTSETIKAPLQARSEWIKAGILVAVLLFAIYIIQKITSENSSDVSNLSENVILEPITDQALFSRYTSNEESKILSIEPPYYFSLRASVPLGYQYSLDDTSPISSNLVSGEQITREFKSKFRLRINRSVGTEFQINDYAVPLGLNNYPIDVYYNSADGQLKFTLYKPK